MTTTSTEGYPIGVVARETGVGTATLRKWELRYGFPVPHRTPTGARRYTAEQLQQLHEIKRQLDAGARPGDVIGAGTAAPGPLRAPVASPDSPTIAAVLDALRAHDIARLRQLLQRDLLSKGLARFIRDTAAPLTIEVGEAWFRREISVFQEHVFSDNLAALLIDVARQLGEHRLDTTVVLTTLPGELHLLGLLMLKTLLLEQGARCVMLGAQTPVADVVDAAAAYAADVVCVSFSASYPARMTRPVLLDLRARLPDDVALWVGGAGLAQFTRPVNGVRTFTSLGEATDAFKRAYGPQRPLTR